MPAKKNRRRPRIYVLIAPAPRQRFLPHTRLVGKGVIDGHADLGDVVSNRLAVSLEQVTLEDHA